MNAVTIFAFMTMLRIFVGFMENNKFNNDGRN
jgi:hypothetical protein